MEKLLNILGRCMEMSWLVEINGPHEIMSENSDFDYSCFTFGFVFSVVIVTIVLVQAWPRIRSYYDDFVKANSATVKSNNNSDTDNNFDTDNMN